MMIMIVRKKKKSTSSMSSKIFGSNMSSSKTFGNRTDSVQKSSRNEIKNSNLYRESLDKSKYPYTHINTNTNICYSNDDDDYDDDYYYYSCCCYYYYD